MGAGLGNQKDEQTKEKKMQRIDTAGGEMKKEELTRPEQMNVCQSKKEHEARNGKCVIQTKPVNKQGCG